MDGACGSVSLDRYWNYVATPFLFTILGFGMYTLFGMNEMQLVGRSYVMKQVDKIGTAMGSDSAPPPPPPSEKDVASEAAAVAKESLTPKLGKEIANSTNAALDKRRKAAEAAGRKSNAAAAAAAAAAAPAPAPAPAAPPPAKQ